MTDQEVSVLLPPQIWWRTAWQTRICIRYYGTCRLRMTGQHGVPCMLHGRSWVEKPHVIREFSSTEYFRELKAEVFTPLYSASFKDQFWYIFFSRDVWEKIPAFGYNSVMDYSVPFLDLSLFAWMRRYFCYSSPALGGPVPECCCSFSEDVPAIHIPRIRRIHVLLK